MISAACEAAGMTEKEPGPSVQASFFLCGSELTSLLPIIHGNTGVINANNKRSPRDNKKAKKKESRERTAWVKESAEAGWLGGVASWIVTRKQVKYQGEP